MFAVGPGDSVCGRAVHRQHSLRYVALRLERLGRGAQDLLHARRRQYLDQVLREQEFDPLHSAIRKSFAAFPQPYLSVQFDGPWNEVVHLLIAVQFWSCSYPQPFFSLPSQFFSDTDGGCTGLSSLLSRIPRPVCGLNLFLVQPGSKSGSSTCISTTPDLGDGSDRSLGAMSDTDPVNDWVRCWRGGLLEGLFWVENSCRDGLSPHPPRWRGRV